MSDFYVYALLRSENGEPFYIGKGKGRRLLDHEHPSRLKNDRSYKANTIRKVVSQLGYLPKKKLLENLTEEQAFYHEISLITTLRSGGVRLTNQTNGGDGRSGYVASIETRERHSVATKAALASPESRAARSETVTAVWKNPNKRAAITAGLQASWDDPEGRTRRLDMFSTVMSDPVVCERRTASIRATYANNHLLCSEISDRMTTTWANPVERERRSLAMKAAWARRRAKNLPNN